MVSTINNISRLINNNKMQRKRKATSKTISNKLFSLTLKFIGLWFVFSFIATFIYCSGSHDGFCGLAIIGFLSEPLFFIGDILASLGLYKIIHIANIPKFLTDIGTSIILVLWFLSWLFVTRIYLFIKNQLEFFLPNVKKIVFFLFILLIFSPISFTCPSNYNSMVNDARYCPGLSSWEKQEQISCNDPRYKGDLSNTGQCVLKSSGTNYECLVCKYPRFGFTLFQFRKPGSEISYHYYAFLALLMLLEYSLSCFIYSKYIKK